jgi:hypothetical protein
MTHCLKNRYYTRAITNEDRRCWAAAIAWTEYIARIFAASNRPVERWADADIDELVETACVHHGADHNRIRWYCENRLLMADSQEGWPPSPCYRILASSERAQFTRVATRLKECGYESF